MTAGSSGPNEVLTELIAAAKRSNRRCALERFNSICAAQAKTTKDFSLATLSVLSQAAGIFKQGRCIYNPKSQPYRALASAWERSYGSSPNDGPNQTGLPFADILAKIPDPAAKALVMATYVKAGRLESENRLLKSKSNVVVDMRPLPQSSSGGGAPCVALTPSERAALERAVSQEFISSEGWVELEAGRIATRKGRTVFEAGFVTGLRKVLASLDDDSRT